MSGRWAAATGRRAYSDRTRVPTTCPQQGEAPADDA